MRSCAYAWKKAPFRGLREERMMGLEPTTFCMASRRSSQLSYIRIRTASIASALGVEGLVDQAVGELVVGPPDRGVTHPPEPPLEVARLCP